MLIIDEGDSLAATRAQEHSHHEDKVAVNTLIQCIDDLRRLGGRVVVFLCTNRLSVLDAALQRRAAIVEEFIRPDEGEPSTAVHHGYSRSRSVRAPDPQPGSGDRRARRRARLDLFGYSHAAVSCSDSERISIAGSKFRTPQIGSG